MAQITIQFKNTKASNIAKGLYINNPNPPKDVDGNLILSDLQYLQKTIEDTIKRYELDGRRQTFIDQARQLDLDPTVTGSE